MIQRQSFCVNILHGTLGNMPATFYHVSVHTHGELYTKGSILLQLSVIKATGQSMFPARLSFWHGTLMLSLTKLALENHPTVTKANHKRTPRNVIWTVILGWAAFIASLGHIQSGDHSLDAPRFFVTKLYNDFLGKTPNTQYLKTDLTLEVAIETN